MPACLSTVAVLRRVVASGALVFFLILQATVLAQDTGQLVEESEYARGIRAFAEGDFEKAAGLWLADAYLGSADAQFNIGVLHVEGKGLPEDRGEAMFWFEKAAGQGHREAQYNLGHLLLEANDDPEKVRQGIEWWRQSADSGFPIAQYNYGRALYFGIGTDQNREGARSWFERAANGGNDKARTFLKENRGKFVDGLPPIEITEPAVVRAEAPTVEPPAIPSTQVVENSEYMQVRDKSILVYSRFNSFSPIVTRLDANMLLRVISRNQEWLQVEAPGGFPGWVRNEQIEISRGLAEITAAVAVVRADPTESEALSDIGELSKGSKALFLEQHNGWTRVQLPEKIAGWVEVSGLGRVEALPEQIAQVWQSQRVKQKVDALPSTESRAADTQPVSQTSARETPAAPRQPPASTIAYTTAADPQQTIVVASQETKRGRSVPPLAPDKPRRIDGVFEARGVNAEPAEKEGKVADAPNSNESELKAAPRSFGIEPAGTGVDNDNEWLFDRSSGKYTLQLFSMQNRSSAKGQMRSLNRRGQFYSTVISGERWYFVLFGKFLTEQAARSAISRLPRWASAARVRSLARLQVNRCKKLRLYNEDEARGLAELCR